MRAGNQQRVKVSAKWVVGGLVGLLIIIISLVAFLTHSHHHDVTHQYHVNPSKEHLRREFPQQARPIVDTNIDVSISVVDPTAAPTALPTMIPSARPTVEPTTIPTASPTISTPKIVPSVVSDSSHTSATPDFALRIVSKATELPVTAIASPIKSTGLIPWPMVYERFESKPGDDYSRTKFENSFPLLRSIYRRKSFSRGKQQVESQPERIDAANVTEAFIRAIRTGDICPPHSRSESAKGALSIAKILLHADDNIETFIEVSTQSLQDSLSGELAILNPALTAVLLRSLDQDEGISGDFEELTDDQNIGKGGEQLTDDVVNTKSQSRCGRQYPVPTNVYIVNLPRSSVLRDPSSESERLKSKSLSGKFNCVQSLLELGGDASSLLPFEYERKFGMELCRCNYTVIPYKTPNDAYFSYWESMDHLVRSSILATKGLCNVSIELADSAIGRLTSESSTATSTSSSSKSYTRTSSSLLGNYFVVTRDTASTVKLSTKSGKVAVRDMLALNLQGTSLTKLMSSLTSYFSTIGQAQSLVQIREGNNDKPLQSSSKTVHRTSSEEKHHNDEKVLQEVPVHDISDLVIQGGRITNDDPFESARTIENSKLWIHTLVSSHFHSMRHDSPRVLSTAHERSMLSSGSDSNATLGPINMTFSSVPLHESTASNISSADIVSIFANSTQEQQNRSGDEALAVHHDQHRRRRLYGTTSSTPDMQPLDVTLGSTMWQLPENELDIPHSHRLYTDGPRIEVEIDSIVQDLDVQYQSESTSRTRTTTYQYSQMSASDAAGIRKQQRFIQYNEEDVALRWVSVLSADLAGLREIASKNTFSSGFSDPTPNKSYFLFSKRNGYQEVISSSIVGIMGKQITLLTAKINRWMKNADARRASAGAKLPAGDLRFSALNKDIQPRHSSVLSVLTNPSGVSSHMHYVNSLLGIHNNIVCSTEFSLEQVAGLLASPERLDLNIIQVDITVRLFLLSLLADSNIDAVCNFGLFEETLSALLMYSKISYVEIPSMSMLISIVSLVAPNCGTLLQTRYDGQLSHLFARVTETLVAGVTAEIMEMRVRPGSSVSRSSAGDNVSPSLDGTTSEITHQTGIFRVELAFSLTNTGISSHAYKGWNVKDIPQDRFRDTVSMENLDVNFFRRHAEFGVSIYSALLFELVPYYKRKLLKMYVDLPIWSLDVSDVDNVHTRSLYMRFSPGDGEISLSSTLGLWYHSPYQDLAALASGASRGSVLGISISGSDGGSNVGITVERRASKVLWASIKQELTTHSGDLAGGLFSFVEHNSGFGYLSTFLAQSYPNATIISVESDPKKVKYHTRMLAKLNISNNAVCLKTSTDSAIFRNIYESPELFRYQLISRGLTIDVDSTDTPSLSPSSVSEWGNNIGAILSSALTTFISVPSASQVSLAMFVIFGDFGHRFDAASEFSLDSIFLDQREVPKQFNTLSHHPSGSYVEFQSNWLLGDARVQGGATKVELSPMFAANNLDVTRSSATNLPLRRAVLPLVRVDIVNMTRHVHHHYDYARDGHTRTYTMHIGYNESLTDHAVTMLGVNDISATKSMQTDDGIMLFVSSEPIHSLPNEIPRSTVPDYLTNLVPDHSLPEVPNEIPKSKVPYGNDALYPLNLVPDHPLPEVPDEIPKLKVPYGNDALYPPNLVPDHQLPRNSVDSISDAPLSRRLSSTTAVSGSILLPPGAHISQHKVISVHLHRDRDGFPIPYTSLYGITLITALRLGLESTQRDRLFEHFLKLPLYEDMAPWNIVLMGQSVDYIDYDTKMFRYDGDVPNAYMVMTVLMNYKRTVEDFKKCSGIKAPTVYGLPYVSDCVGGASLARSLSCPDLHLPVPCGDGTCHSDYISCLRSLSDQAANLTVSRAKTEPELTQIRTHLNSPYSSQSQFGHGRWNRGDHELARSVAAAMRVSVGLFDQSSSKISKPID